MDNPQPSPKATCVAMDTVHRLNGSGPASGLRYSRFAMYDIIQIDLCHIYIGEKHTARRFYRLNGPVKFLGDSMKLLGQPNGNAVRIYSNRPI